MVFPKPPTGLPGALRKKRWDDRSGFYQSQSASGAHSGDSRAAKWGQEALSKITGSAITGWLLRRIKGFINPGPQIPVSKEIPAQQCDQVGEGPTGLGAHLQILQQQHGDQCCPNLDMHGIGTGAHEGFNPRVLFESFEKQLNLPTFLVDFADGVATEVADVGDQFQGLVIFGMVDGYQTQDLLALAVTRQGIGLQGQILVGKSPSVL